MLVQHRFDLGGVDVEAGADDQLLGAAADVEGVAVEAREIAGVEPAIGVDHRCSRLRGPVIAAHDIGSADVQLADLARCNSATAGRDATPLDSGTQPADSDAASSLPNACDRGGACGDAVGV